MKWCVLSVENPCFDMSSGRAGTWCITRLFWMNSLGVVVQKILHITICSCVLDSNILDRSSYKTGQGILNHSALMVMWFNVNSKSCFIVAGIRQHSGHVHFYDISRFMQCNVQMKLQHLMSCLQYLFALLCLFALFCVFTQISTRKGLFYTQENNCS